MRTATISTTAPASEAVSGRAQTALSAACSLPGPLAAQSSEIGAVSRDVVKPAQLAHRAAEEAEITARARALADTATAAGCEALRRASITEASTDRAWIRAYEKRDRMIVDLLATEVTTAADALLKAEAAVQLSSDGKFSLTTTNDLYLLREVVCALARDIGDLGGAPPSLPHAIAA
jgi:hypothetical protein